MVKSSRKIVEIHDIRDVLHDKNLQQILVLSTNRLYYFDMHLNQIRLVEFQEDYYKILSRSGQLFLIAISRGYFNLSSKQYIKTERFVKDINVIQNQVFYVEQLNEKKLSWKLESNKVEHHKIDVNINPDLEVIYHLDHEDATIYLYVDHKDKNITNILKIIKSPQGSIVDVIEMRQPKLIYQDGNFVYFILDTGHIKVYNKLNKQMQQLDSKYPIQSYQKLKIIDNILSILRDEDLLVFDLQDQYQLHNEYLCRNVEEVFNYNNNLYMRTATNQIWRYNKFILVNKKEVKLEDKRFQKLFCYKNKYFIYFNELTCGQICLKYQSQIKKLLFYGQIMFICLEQEIIEAQLDCQQIHSIKIQHLLIRQYDRYLYIYDNKGDIYVYYNQELKLIYKSQNLLDFDVCDDNLYIIDNSSYVKIINLTTNLTKYFDSNVFCKRVIATNFGCVLINDDVVLQFQLLNDQIDKKYTLNRSEFSKLKEIYKYEGFIIIVFNSYLYFETFVYNINTLQRLDTNFEFLDCDDDSFYMKDEFRQLYKCTAKSHLSQLREEDSIQMHEKTYLLPITNKIFENCLRIKNNVVVKNNQLISLDSTAFRVYKSYILESIIEKCSFKDNFILVWSNQKLSVYYKSLRVLNNFREIIAPDSILAATMHKTSVIVATSLDIFIYYPGNTVKKMQFANSPKTIIDIMATENEIDLLHMNNGVQTLQYQYNEAKIRHKINCPILSQDHFCLVKIGTNRVTFNSETQSGDLYCDQLSMFGPFYKKTQSFNMKDIILQSEEFKGQQFVVGILGGLWVFEY